jgi:cytochrome c peroxidase
VDQPAGGATVLAAGYGADRLVELTWPADVAAAPAVTTRAILPGAASMASSGDLTVFADPLFDAWFSLSPASASAPVPVPVPDAPSASPSPPRSAASRVGEALFFTNLMAPWNRSEGRLSRFTCETCHFEGYVDGRIHHTGRGDVRATTKPLLGLFNNRPHFSRALDRDLACMVDNEFRAAGAKSDHDPWFTAAEAGLPWVPLLGVPVAELDATALREALMAFLMDFTHRPNPAVLGRTSFTDRERRGAEVFARRCESCHAARLSADDPATRVPPARWEALVLSREGPIVWGSIGYKKTGVEPYVHDEGARTPSLRRLYAKRPYFTNGSAKSLREVLDRVGFRGEETWHDKAPEGAVRLGAEEIEGLLGFLELL